jgi:hypothetical protein
VFENVCLAHLLQLAAIAFLLIDVAIISVSDKFYTVFGSERCSYARVPEVL